MTTKGERRPLTPKDNVDEVEKVQRFQFKRQYSATANGGTVSRRNGCLTRLANTTPLPLSIPIGIHYTFVTLSLITTVDNPWLPAYFFSHIVVILVCVWAARDVAKSQPVLLYMYILFMSCIVDSIQIGAYFPRFNDGSFSQDFLNRSLFLLSFTAVLVHFVLKFIIGVYSFFVLLQRWPYLLHKLSCCCSSQQLDEEAGNHVASTDISINSHRNTIQDNDRHL